MHFTKKLLKTLNEAWVTSSHNKTAIQRSFHWNCVINIEQYRTLLFLKGGNPLIF